MKLVIAVVHNDDANVLNEKLNSAGFQLTKISSTGGFLHSGNSTFLSGVENDKIDEFVDIVSHNCKRRTESLPDMHVGISRFSNYPNKIAVGGANIFIIDIEKYIRV